MRRSARRLLLASRDGLDSSNCTRTHFHSVGKELLEFSSASPRSPRPSLSLVYSVSFFHLSALQNLTSAPLHHFSSPCALTPALQRPLTLPPSPSSNSHLPPLYTASTASPRFTTTAKRLNKSRSTHSEQVRPRCSRNGGVERVGWSSPVWRGSWIEKDEGAY